MDIESIIEFKLIMLSIAWLVFSPIYMVITEQEFKPKNMAICLAPMIIYAAWFMVFFWG